MDSYDKRGILGERSVIRILKQHNFRNLRVAGIKGYSIHSTRGTEMQKKEIDLIEKWIDANGNMHTKAHEVKCENPTLNFYFSKASRETRTALEAAYMTGVKKQDQWQCKPTGNYFIELVQSVSREEADKALGEYNEDHSLLDLSQYNGWYSVFGESGKYIEENFTEGRDIWFVSYTPKPQPMNERIEDPETGEVLSVDPSFKRELERGFIVMQLPDDGTHDQLFKYVCGKLEGTTSKNENTSLYSMGVLLPIDKLFPVFPVDGPTGRIISGYAYRDSGAVLYNDLSVWTCEKDIGERWTREDGEIDSFIWGKI